MARRSNQKGSVLMEFVIVAPLYFLLLGGVFMIGDMIINRIRMHNGDHLATWIGASRFCPKRADSLKKDKDAVDRLVMDLFDRAIGGVVPSDQSGGLDSDWFDVFEDQNIVNVNRFMGLHYGGILKLPVNVPAWVRGMLGMQGIMQGDGAGEVFLMKTHDFQCGDYRSYSFHRLPMAGLDDASYPVGAEETVSRSKMVPAADLVLRGILDNVREETWVSTGQVRVPSDLQPRPLLKEKQRYLRGYGE